MVTTPTASTKYVGIYNGTSSSVPSYTAFTWSKYVGDNGVSPTNIVCGNEAQIISCNNDGTVAAATTISIPYAGYIGNTRAACTVTYSTPLPSGITYNSSSSSSASTSGDGVLVFDVAANATLGNASNGVITLTFTCNSLNFIKKFAWSKSIKGDKGTDGKSPYTAYLTNEAQVLMYGTANTITTQLYGYEGTTEQTVTIKSIDGVTASTSTTPTTKTGLNFAVDYVSAVKHPIITFTTTTDLPQSQTAQIPIVYKITGELNDRTIYFSYSTTTKGSTGTAAKVVIVNPSSQMFKSTTGPNGTFTPQYIYLYPTFQGVSYSKWQYSTDGSS
jgi:hypothetical protein